MKLINLTPHPITIIMGISEVTFKPSGYPARVPFEKEVIEILDGIEVVKRVFGELCIPKAVMDLGTHYLVSHLVIEYIRSHPASVKDTSQFLCPDTGPTALRDRYGNIKAVRRLICV